MRLCCVCAALLLAACAKAESSTPPDAERIDAMTIIGGRSDSSIFHEVDAALDGKQIDAAPPPIDAEPIDAPPGKQTVTLTQTSTSTLLANNSIACGPSDGGTNANTYYRVFDLATAGVTGPFAVSAITFQVEDCESIDGNGMSVKVAVGTYSGTVGSTLTPTDITIAETSGEVAVPEVDEGSTSTPGATVATPISATIAANSQMVVEVIAPDGADATNEAQFYIGTNQSGESGISYFSAPDCDPPGSTPSDMGTVAGHETDFLLTVTGTFTP